VTARSDQKKELPIACTLGAGDFEARLAELAALGARRLISVDHPHGGGPVRLSFKSDPETKAKLQSIVAAEAECCAFLQLTITAGDLLELTIDGPDDAAPVIDGLVAAFGAGAET
jgi:hypothetical protein